EENDPADSRARRDVRVDEHLVDRGLKHTRHRFDRSPNLGARPNEQRQHELRRTQRRLTDETAERLGPSKTARAIDRNLWHGPEKLTRPSRSELEILCAARSGRDCLPRTSEVLPTLPGNTSSAPLQTAPPARSFHAQFKHRAVPGAVACP